MALTNSEKIRLSKNLCCLDPRNPDSDPDVVEEDLYPKKDCCCDNCFYGCTWLSEKLLELDDEIMYLEAYRGEL